MDVASKHLIYALVDPRDGSWRYVGKSSSGLKRPRAHGFASNVKRGCHRSSWIRNLQDYGLAYDIEILEELDAKALLNDAEREWIAACRRAGVDLTNHTDGGDGQSLGFRHTAASRRKMSDARRGKPLSEECKRKLSERQRGPLNHRYGKSLPLQQMEAMNAAWRGCRHTQEHRLKMSMRMRGEAHWNWGRTASDETVKRMSLAHKGKCTGPKSNEHRAALSKARGGKPFTDGSVTFNTLSEAAQRYRCDPSDISKVLRGKAKTVHGVAFFYLSEVV
jgi:group I intron endonuclease